MKLPMDMTGVTRAHLGIFQHEDGKRFVIVFSTNFGSVEKEFSSERAAVREYKRMYKAIRRTKPAFEYKHGWAADLV